MILNDVLVLPECLCWEAEEFTFSILGGPLVAEWLLC